MVAVSPLSSRQEESVDGSGGGGGGEQCDSSKEWGQLGQDIQNGTACVNECLERFRRDVLKDAAPDDPTENQDLLLCKALSASEKGVGDTKQNGGGEGRKGMRRGTARFNHLYCCDSVVCGIWFNKTAGADPQGQDRESDPHSSFSLLACSAFCQGRILMWPHLPPSILFTWPVPANVLKIVHDCHR